MKSFCLVLGILIILSCEAPFQKPNVLFILVDDLGWTDLSCYGSSFYNTPNLDELAGRSVRFTNAYSASPVCSPTRAAIMTGKHPVRVNITDWIPGMPVERAKDPKLIPPEDIHDLPLEEETLAEVFQANGYQTCFAGKWHLGMTADYWPEYQGFDYNFGGHDKGSPPGGYYSPYDNPRLNDGPEGEYLTDRLTDECIQFIDDKKSQPFFMFLAFYTVHTPIEGCVKYDEEYKAKQELLPLKGQKQIIPERSGKTRINQSDYKYAAMVRSMDENVGRLLNKLESSGLSKNTIVVFTSDNGGLATSPNGGPTAVLPLRAGKGWCYEGGIRVPAMIYYPGLKNGGVECASPIISMDFYPTLLQLAGLSVNSNQVLDGISLLPFLDEPQHEIDRTLVWHFPHYHASTWTPGSAIRVGNYKLVEFYEENELELYNLKSDPGEQNDLAEVLADKAKDLRNTMRTFIDDYGGAFPKVLQ